MSGEMALWAVRQDIKDPIAKLVLVALCEHCNEVGECFPNHETLTEYVRRSKPYIREKIRWLEQDGWLKRTPRFNGKRQTSNLYTIIEDRGESRKDYHARKAREAEEKATKRLKSTPSGDGGQSPKSMGDAMKAGPRDGGQSPVRVMAGNHPGKNQEGKKSASGGFSSSQKKAVPSRTARPSSSAAPADRPMGSAGGASREPEPPTGAEREAMKQRMDALKATLKGNTIIDTRRRVLNDR